MLGQPVSMLIPEVVGFKLTGRMIEGTTATDLVLKVVQMLRKKGVVNKFVEFYGDGPRPPAARRPRDDRQHGARVRRHLRLLPDRRRDAALPAPDRPRRGADRAGRGLRQGERHAGAGRTTSRSTPTRCTSTWPRSCRRSPGRSGRRTRRRSSHAAAAFYKTVADYRGIDVSTAAERDGGRGRRRRRRRPPDVPQDRERSRARTTRSATARW